MNKILVVGDGLIGNAVFKHLSKNHIPANITSRKSISQNQRVLFLDLATKQWPKLSGFTHAVVAASITGFSLCEKNPAQTREINVSATLELAKALIANNCHVIYLSSTAVFSGNAPFPNEYATRCPTSEYGRQKAEVEESILQLTKNATIIRLTKVASLKNPIFLQILTNLKNHKTFDVFDDLNISPISLPYVCESVTKVIENNISGVIHLSNAEHLSYARFAIEFANMLKIDPCFINEIHSPSNIATSPYNNLGMERTTSVLKTNPESLTQVISDLLAEETDDMEACHAI